MSSWEVLAPPRDTCVELLLGLADACETNTANSVTKGQVSILYISRGVCLVAENELTVCRGGYVNEQLAELNVPN